MPTPKKKISDEEVKKKIARARKRLERLEREAEGLKPKRSPAKKKDRMKGGQATKRKFEDQKIVTVSLGLRHSANGTTYGPGQVTGPASIVMPFFHRERRIAKEEMKLLQPRAKILSWSRTGPKLIPVSPGRLDGLLAMEYGMAVQEKL